MISENTPGWDYFTPDNFKTFKTKNCLACGCKLKLVKKNNHGATGFAEAMAKRGHKHDVVSCPNAGKDWHSQLIGIKKVIINTPSKVLANMLEKEAKELIRTKKATKKDFDHWI